MRLPRSFRFIGKRAFHQVRLANQRYVGRYFVINICKKPDLAHSHFAVITTKKLGKAVVRNTLRRRVHAIHAHFSSKIQGDSHYILTIVRWRAPHASFDQLKKDWEICMQALHLLK